MEEMRIRVVEKPGQAQRTLAALEDMAPVAVDLREAFPSIAPIEKREALLKRNGSRSKPPGSGTRSGGWRRNDGDHLRSLAGESRMNHTFFIQRGGNPPPDRKRRRAWRC
ncbi:hypothetical protein HPP92_020520 [Vanilla planifolia]|uniref:Uncharacterized protein n=1 Tax=Vanilla planifolia TaxID=51239 RepID=A0A835Q1E9_VANPL|nr:hypothetical protein HPP92_020520 [Vanilla planifolia]